MGKIKDFFDLFVGASLTLVDRNIIRNNLKEELSLNLDFLKAIKNRKSISDAEMRVIVNNLEYSELSAFLEYRTLDLFKSNRRVTAKVVGDIPAKSLLKTEPTFIELCRNIRRKIKYIKKNYNALRNPKKSLLFIKNYIRIAKKIIT
jgi:hypothetical protein